MASVVSMDLLSRNRAGEGMQANRFTVSGLINKEKENATLPRA
jgi:hypothetical protein